MWVILGIFLLIIVVVISIFLGTILLLKKLNLKQTRKIEILGYVLLCIILIWELVFKNLMSSEFYGIDMFYLEQKISIIYSFITNSLDKYEANRLFYYDGGKEYVKEQLFTIDVIENVLKVFSTYFITIGRLYELVNEK